MFELILKLSLSDGFPRPLPDFHPPAEEKLYGHPLGPAELKSDGWHRSFQRCQVFVSPLTAWEKHPKLNCLLFLSIFRSFSKVFPSLPSHTVISGGFRWGFWLMFALPLWSCLRQRPEHRKNHPDWWRVHHLKIFEVSIVRPGMLISFF